MNSCSDLCCIGLARHVPIVSHHHRLSHLRREVGLSSLEIESSNSVNKRLFSKKKEQVLVLLVSGTDSFVLPLEVRIEKEVRSVMLKIGLDNSYQTNDAKMFRI